jgi:hypothetical protein
MALITITDAHAHPRTGVLHDWHAIYIEYPDGASVSVIVSIPGRERGFKLQTYLTFDPATVNTNEMVSEFVKRLIDATDFNTVELNSQESGAKAG